MGVGRCSFGDEGDDQMRCRMKTMLTGRHLGPDGNGGKGGSECKGGGVHGTLTVTIRTTEGDAKQTIGEPLDGDRCCYALTGRQKNRGEGSQDGVWLCKAMWPI